MLKTTPLETVISQALISGSIVQRRLRRLGAQLRLPVS